MTIPSDLSPIIDGDVIRYEIGFAAETGWRAITEDPDSLPPWDYVEGLLTQRLDNTCAILETTQRPLIYLSEGRSFRDNVATLKPYKGTRVSNKPWHYDNLTAYLRGYLGAIVVSGIEADDAMAIDHVASRGTTVLCSRDKDLKQVPGWFYSWELGKQPQFGPELITRDGYIELSDKNKLTGTGLAFFYAQVLMGDAVDNIPGLPKCGPVGTYALLKEKSIEDQLAAIILEYQKEYGEVWEERLTEQGRLCWLLRKPNEMWEIGKIE